MVKEKIFSKYNAKTKVYCRTQCNTRIGLRNNKDYFISLVSHMEISRNYFNWGKQKFKVSGKYKIH